ncbi:phosphocholine cytidylyltransferase family protein [Oscillospiraceae bacterium HV4-5-C5C]|nr:phosphocholine cytidylyltransferase family protein [Oscillospiraceae bacterium HV4-5-C5C]
MKAILMAAGRGSRISRHIGSNPKCTLDVGGTALIRHTVEMLLAHDIEVVLVLGYRGEVIKAVLAGLPVTYYENPFYDVTNSIASLWFARQEIGGQDLILGNADVYWDEDILNAMLQDQRVPLMLADSSRLEEGDYLFKWEQDCLVKHGKGLKLPDITGEYVGIALLRQAIQPWFKKRLEDMIDQQEHQVWWENVLYSAIGEKNIYVKDIKPCFWGEVDYIEDYYRIVQYRKDKGLTNLTPDDLVKRLPEDAAQQKA